MGPAYVDFHQQDLASKKAVSKQVDRITHFIGTVILLPLSMQDLFIGSLFIEWQSRVSMEVMV